MKMPVLNKMHLSIIEKHTYHTTQCSVCWEIYSDSGGLELFAVLSYVSPGRAVELCGVSGGPVRRQLWQDASQVTSLVTSAVHGWHRFMMISPELVFGWDSAHGGSGRDPLPQGREREPSWAEWRCLFHRPRHPASAGISPCRSLFSNRSLFFRLLSVIDPVLSL